MNRQFVYSCKLGVRWRDLDDLGHVNNAVYFTYFEHARVMWWDELGVKLKSMEEGPTLITAECTFLKQLFCPAELEVKIYVGPPGRSSYMMYYELLQHNGGEETLIATGSTKVVWANYKLGKSVPLPASITDQLPAKE